MTSGYSPFALLLALCLAPCIKAGEPMTQPEALTLVKAFLYQDFRIIDGKKYTAALFASKELNALASLDLSADPRADAVRLAVEADQREYASEYSVRSHLAQARTSAAGDSSDAALQQNLWRIFLEDPRYTIRILGRIADVIPLATPLGAPPPLTTDRVALARLAQALAESFGERAKEVGCNSGPLTTLPAVAHEDPMLVTVVLTCFTQREPKDRTLASALDAAHAAGWTVRE